MAKKRNINIDPHNRLKLSVRARAELAELLAQSTVARKKGAMGAPRVYGPEARLARIKRILEIHRALHDPNDEKFSWLPKAVKAMRDESLVALHWKDDDTEKGLRARYFDMLNLTRRQLNQVLTTAAS